MYSQSILKTLQLLNMSINTRKAQQKYCYTISLMAIQSIVTLFSEIVRKTWGVFSSERVLYLVVHVNVH